VAYARNLQSVCRRGTSGVARHDGAEWALHRARLLGRSLHQMRNRLEKFGSLPEART